MVISVPFKLFGPSESFAGGGYLNNFTSPNQHFSIPIAIVDHNSSSRIAYTPSVHTLSVRTQYTQCIDSALLTLETIPRP